ncbi:MAG: R3H domain-containing nucleic acid-binding protein [Thermoanaerobaculia bacterium]|nr:R3H domain-containing nucleic acid-binding protein [Thermoanaerobaculia bacterium]
MKASTDNHETRVTDDLDLLLAVLPERVRAAIGLLTDRQELLEVVLDLGRAPEARFEGRVVELAEAAVERAELAGVVERLGRFGVDNRAGIERTLHRISAIRNRDGAVVGLTCRVGRAVYGTVAVLRDVIEAGRSILLLGRPGVGKTTLLREAARVLADELAKRVVVVDTSNEIAGDGDIPHPGIGRARRMQVPNAATQHAVMIEAVENHMPEVIVIDEIGTSAEALAARTIAERGVQLIATVHGNTLDNLLQNPTLSDLLGGIHAVTLSDEEARRRNTQKTVLERKAPPSFDIVVEIRDKARFAVHHGVAEVVDQHLRGIAPNPELRVRTAEGVEITPPVERDDDGRARGPGARVPGRLAERARRRLKIFPYALARERLERAIKDLGAPVDLLDEARHVDLILTVKSHERRLPRKLKEAQLNGAPVVVLRSNSQHQMESFLRAELGLDDLAELSPEAHREVEAAIDRVLDRGRPVELAPQVPAIRRLQHLQVETAGLGSASFGEEPHRRLVVYPPNGPKRVTRR